ncbi:MAG: hypothetical protein V9G19_00260 [Tetrasphaera sp.]
MSGRNWVLLILGVVFLGVVWWLLRNSRREDDLDVASPATARVPGGGDVPVGPAVEPGAVPTAAPADVAAPRRPDADLGDVEPPDADPGEVDRPELVPGRDDLSDLGRLEAERSGAIASADGESAVATEEQVIVHWDGVEGSAEDEAGRAEPVLDGEAVLDAEDVETSSANLVHDEQVAPVNVDRAEQVAGRDDLADPGRLEAERAGAAMSAGGLAQPAAYDLVDNDEPPAAEEQINVHWDGVEGTDGDEDTGTEESAPNAEENRSAIGAQGESVSEIPEGEGPGAPDWQRPENTESGADQSRGDADPPQGDADEPHDHAVWDGGWGVGSAAPNDDGCMPLGHPIKGVLAYGVYQVPGSDWYAATTPDVWFIDEETAQRAGFRRGDG